MSHFEHKGIAYEVRGADDGAWRWLIHLPMHGKFRHQADPNTPPRKVYSSRATAIGGAKYAIDAIVARCGDVGVKRADLNKKPRGMGRQIKELMDSIVQERPDLKSDPLALAEEVVRRAQIKRQAREKGQK